MAANLFRLGGFISPTLTIQVDKCYSTTKQFINLAAIAQPDINVCKLKNIELDLLPP